jgi:hypothetical protein
MIDNITPPAVKDICKRIALADFDNDIQSIALVMVNAKGELEMEIGFDDFNKYRIIAGLALLQNKVLNWVADVGTMPGKDRE